MEGGGGTGGERGGRKKDMVMKDVPYDRPMVTFLIVSL